MLSKIECELYLQFINRHQRYLYSLLGNYLCRRVDSPKPKVLDLGTGPGYLSQEILLRSNADIVALDNNPAMLELARKNLEVISLNRWNVELGDVHSLPFHDSSFDMVVSYSCFHHWNDPLQALIECKRILNPRGKLFLFDTIREVAETAVPLLRTTISDPALFRFVEEAFKESVPMEVALQLARRAGLTNTKIVEFGFEEEDLIACLDELPVELPELLPDDCPTTLWLLESIKDTEDFTMEARE